MLSRGHNLSSLCSVTWDRVTCWPFASPGTTVHLPCMRELNGVFYDQRDNVSRFCQSDGTWEPRSNYSACQPIVPSLHSTTDRIIMGGMRDVTLSENLATLHLLGYAVSVAVLGIGLFIFIRFKDLRCVRNTIHIHLMLTYLLLDTCWLLAATSQLSRLLMNLKHCNL
ncbi:diuretic hormone receptor-like [Penaeus monodon]|uniref:diuretic hormone receptor-like n=1 Tax=Penaeus monodon TaxID=6687 RepID=UPI0018A71D66|nr:diuretic hormone receptor-like [Penaeus monodon]